MPEAAAWQFKDVKRVPAKRAPDEKIVARGRVFTGGSDTAIDDGFVRIEKGKITAVGAAGDLGSGADGAVSRRRLWQDRRSQDSSTTTRTWPGMGRTISPPRRSRMSLRSRHTSAPRTCSGLSERE